MFAQREHGSPPCLRALKFMLSVPFPSESARSLVSRPILPRVWIRFYVFWCDTGRVGPVSLTSSPNLVQPFAINLGPLPRSHLVPAYERLRPFHLIHPSPSILFTIPPLHHPSPSLLFSPLLDINSVQLIPFHFIAFPTPSLKEPDQNA